MSQKVKTPKSVVITLIAGFGLGTLAMAGLQSGIVTPQAFAQSTHVSARPIADMTSENIAALKSLDASFANLADFVAPAVVDIKATTGRQMGPQGQRMPVRAGEGSGFIFRSDGYIITNDHVVAGAEKVTVVTKDGREYPGKVMRAQESDIAVIKIEAKDLPVLGFADSNQLKPGQLCMAVGAPFGLENSVTFGHISALGRDTDIADGNPYQAARYYPDLIQTDASINMGNSGGPLVNVDGQVVGVNTAIYSPTGTSAGIGFAIPSNQARLIAELLIEKGKVTRAMMGLYPQNLKEYEKADMKISGGARVIEINTPGPAASAGLKKDDIVVKIGDTPINSQLDLRNAMLVYSPGTTVDVEYLRAGKRHTAKVKLEEYKIQSPEPQQRRLVPGDGMPKLPEGFDAPDMEFFKEFGDRLRKGTPKLQDETDVPALREGQAKLGVSVGNITSALRSEKSIPEGIEGAYVSDVQPGSVAERLGMQAGDLITQLGDKPIKSADELTSEMKKIKWGDSTRIKFSRYGKTTSMQQDMTVTFK